MQQRERRLEGPFDWRRGERPKKPRAKGRWAFLVLAGVLLIAGALVGYGYHEIYSPQGSSSASFAFQVRPGDSAGSIASRLEARHVMHDPLLFRLDARLRGLGGNLRVGTYSLRRNMSIDQMVSTLKSYNVRLIHVTIPEGWRAGQIASRLSLDGIGGRAFLRAVHHPTFGAGFATGRPAHRSLEGLLFPDTYAVAPGTTGRAFARLMVRQFALEFTPLMRSEARKQGRSVYDVLKLASIVEREARVPSERRVIAGVYLNRLRAGWFLDADPTIQYALGRPGDWWPLLSVADLHGVQSPYNTYIHKGLPPGPICDPGLPSILAALHPARTRYMYFVAKGNGHHAFAVTLQQQNANRLRYGGH